MSKVSEINSSKQIKHYNGCLDEFVVMGKSLAIAPLLIERDEFFGLVLSC